MSTNLEIRVLGFCLILLMTSSCSLFRQIYAVKLSPPIELPLCAPVVGKVDPVENTDLRWKWAESASPEFNQNMATPMVADIDGDGVSDFVFSTFYKALFNVEGEISYSSYGVLRVVSGVDGREIWSTDPTSSIRVYGDSIPAVYDLDQDGSPEILVYASDWTSNSRTFGLAVYSSEGNLRAYTPLFASNLGSNNAVMVWDLKLNGVPVVQVKLARGSLFEINVSTMKLTPAPLLTDVMGVMDVDSRSPGQEVITSAEIFSSSMHRLKDLPTVSTNPYSFASFGDFDGDGVADIALQSSSPLTITLVRGTGGLITLWSESEKNAEACKARGATSPSTSGTLNVGDLDGDGRPDITMAGSCFFYALKFIPARPRNVAADLKTLWQLETKDLSSAVTGSSIYDFNGDGKVEVVYNDELYFRIIAGLPNPDGTANVLFELHNNNGTLLENPVVVSLRSGEPASIVLSANSYTAWTAPDDPGAWEAPDEKDVTGIRVIQGGENLWMPTRTLWNQHLYTITNVLDNLQLPGVFIDFVKVSNMTRANKPMIEHPCR